MLRPAVAMKRLPVIASLFIFNTALAQVTFSGFIQNQQGEPVPFATVRLTATPNGAARYFCIADSKGGYTLYCPKKLREGFIEVSAVGYNREVHYFIDSGSAVQNINFKLSRHINSLEEVRIKLEPSIQVYKDTISFKTDAFKTGSEPNIGKLLENIPGFSVESNGRVSFNGEPVNRVLIESDDLAGENYGQLIKHLNTTGIDKVQIIKNYSSPEDITGTITRSGNQVLNIKYKAAFQGKIFGNLKAGAAIPLAYREAGSQTISLLPKWKLISFQSANTLGDIENDPSEKNDRPSPSSADDLSELGFYRPESLAGINDLKTGYSRNNPVYANNSLVSTTRYYLKPAKKFIIKGITDYTSDSYFQSGSVHKTIFLYPGDDKIIQRQRQEVRKKNAVFSNSVFFNYLINERNQLALLIKRNAERSVHSGYGSLQNQLYDERINGNSGQWGGKLVFNHKWAPASALSINIQYQKNPTPLFYRLSPPPFDTFFYKNKNYRLLCQQEHQDFSLLQPGVSYLHKSNRHNLEFALSGARRSTGLNNTIIFFDSASHSQTLDPDSTANIRVLNDEIKARAKDILTLNKKLILTVSPELVFLNFRVLNRMVRSDSATGTFRLLPNLSLDLQLSNADRLSISFTSQNVIPSIKNYASGFFINDLTNVTRGANTLFYGVSHSSNIIFSHIDLTDRQILFFTGIIFQKAPLLYLSNQFPNKIFTLSDFTHSRRQMSTGSAFFRLEKYLPGMNIKFSPAVHLNYGNTYALLQSQEFNTRFAQIKLGTEFSARLHNITLKSRVNFILTTNSNSLAKGDHLKNNMKRLECDFQLSWKIRHGVFFDLDVQKDAAWPPGQKAINFLLPNARVLVNSKNENWQWSLRCNNMFNRDYFSYSFLSPTQSSEVSFRVLPVFLLTGLQYKF
jgi:hypothetical protein